MLQQNMFSSFSTHVADPPPPPLGRSVNSYFWEELVSGSIASRIKESSRDKYVSSSDEVYNVLKPIYAQEPDVERMIGIYTSQKNQIISIETIARGSISSASIYPREIVKAMLHNQATSLVVSHNHPSGDPTPSSEDHQITKHILFALHCIGATLLDHIIIGDNGARYSFADDGLLTNMRKQAVSAFIF